MVVYSGSDELEYDDDNPTVWFFWTRINPIQGTYGAAGKVIRATVLCKPLANFGTIAKRGRSYEAPMALDIPTSNIGRCEEKT